MNDSSLDIVAPSAQCRHCGRRIVNISFEYRPRGEAAYDWVDPEADGDDSVWRKTCDSHDTFMAEHEPIEVPA